MLLTLFIFTLLKCCVFINAGSLVDLPLKIPDQSVIIHATVTDINSGDVFFMQEFISSSFGVQGKIEIESKADSSEVHYSAEQNTQRLIVQETQCNLVNYKSGWDKKLPGVTKSLLNLILLLGPSVLYRIEEGLFQWNKGDDGEVRGTKMHSSSANMNQRLKITRYFKNADELVSRSLRLAFEGYDPGAPISSVKENLIMDIYLHETNEFELDKIAQIPAGIGCPVYLAKGEPLPSLSVRHLQSIVLETINGPVSSSVKNELYLDDEQAIMRLLKTTNGVKTDAIYDYNLGVIYIREENGCLMQPLDLTSPGVDEAGYYSLHNLLWLDRNYLYLGQLDYEHKPGFRVKAWEATEYDIKVHGVQYAKVVTTLYFLESATSDTFNGHALIGSNRNAYKKGSAGDYLLVESKTRDFHELKSSASDDEFSAQFELKDCLPNSDSKIELDFQLSCSEKKCYNLVEERPDEFKRMFKSVILNDKKISPLRVPKIDLKFRPGMIHAYMTFLEGPIIDEPFRKRSITISKDFLSKLGPLTSSGEKACLTLQASIVAPIKTVMFCKNSESGNCYHLEEQTEIVEDKRGPLCSVWQFPLNNLYRVGHELTLQEIHKSMLDKSQYSSITFYGNYFAINNILDITTSIQDDTQFPYSISRHSSKLKVDSKGVKKVLEVKSFASCYQACAHEDEGLCESFSFCQNGEKVDCLVTSTMYDKIEDDAIVDEQCNIYSKNHFYDYHKIKSRRFKTPTSISTSLPLYDCAAFCYVSQECYSFQYCDGFCTFGGYYTDSATEYHSECDIYSPKVAQKYQLSGDETVVESFHTEFNLNMEQCAGLCNEWKSDTEACKSFNFCPKGRALSACYLSQKTVRDGKTVKRDENDCRNYELIDSQSHDGKKSKNSPVNGTSSGAAFGIILLFLLGGLVIGLVAPYVYKRFGSTSSLQSIISLGRSTVSRPTDPGFNWSKQVDDENNDQSRV